MSAGIGSSAVGAASLSLGNRTAVSDEAMEQKGRGEMGGVN